MKKKFTAALAVVAGLAASVFGGCGSPEYGFYTNVPAELYIKKDNSFRFETITGYSEKKEDFDAIDLSGYSSKGWTRAGIVDAQMVVSDDFSKEGAETKFSSLIVDVNAVIDKIDKAVSTLVENSDVTKFNRAAAGETIEISDVAYKIMSLALDAYSFTDGYYNPALYYNVALYGFGSTHKYPSDASELPAEDAIAEYTSLAGHFGEIVLTESDGRYFIEKPAYTVNVDGEEFSMKLDLSGISKGYAVDRIEELFESYSYDYGMFNYGSSSMLVRGNITEGNYRVGLVNPRSPRRDVVVEIPARNQKLSTSGDNEQRYFIDGVRYCHIIDPTTGKPVQTGIMSATVIGGAAAEADALTTAIMCMGKDKAIKFIEEKLTDKKVFFMVET